MVGWVFGLLVGWLVFEWSFFLACLFAGLVDWCVDWCIGRSVGWFLGRLVGCRLIVCWVGRKSLPIGLKFGWLIGWLHG